LVTAVLATGLTASLLVLAGQADPADANHEPANKASAAGSTTQVFGAGTASGTVVTLLSETVRTSAPSDLILGVTAECSITTEVTTVGSDDQSAMGSIRVWVEIDGVAVPVADEGADIGRVVFCNRTYQRTTSLGSDDEQDSIRTFMATRQANAFNWLALDVGSAVHDIQVKAELVTAATQRAMATGVIGNRTLIVEPTMAANDETVTIA
jgi:hypothetical protein